MPDQQNLTSATQLQTGQGEIMSIGYVEMRSLRRDGGHILRDMPLLRVQARQAVTVLPALPRLGREPARKGD